LRSACTIAAPVPADRIAGSGTKTEAGMFWIYWDTAWSLIISGIMFATIVTHPDSEFVEIQAAKQAK
jgi:hypothetical protein